YQIELDKSKSKPLILIGSNEEDDDADENNNDVEQLETAVFRQQANVKPLQQQFQYVGNEEKFKTNNGNETTDLNSNGNDYVFVNCMKTDLNSKQKLHDESSSHIRNDINRDVEGEDDDDNDDDDEHLSSKKKKCNLNNIE
ncbi:unnamed protein product, partial [Didymodactylos carnosus]